MQRIPLLILAFIIVTVTARVPAFPQETAALDKHYQRCINKRLCSTQEDLRFMNQLTEAMRNKLRRVVQVCIKTGYKDCFNPAADDVAATDLAEWHKMYIRLGEVVRVLEARHVSANKKDNQLNLIEPSAGPAPVHNPYTNPDQEWLNENKRDWWQGEGWTPPEEDNPYHKW